jgi:putative tricarboxylic transport membrane protein
MPMKPTAVMATVSAMACVFSALSVQAQTAWRPERNIEIIIPTAAGGINDQVSRLIQKTLQDGKLVGVPVIPINKAGGNQLLAIAYLNQYAGNPHYLLYSAPTVFTNQLGGLTAQMYTDFTPLALLYVEHTVITVATASPLKTMRDLIGRLKTDPTAFAFGVSSRGGPNHLALSQAVRTAGIDPAKLKVVVFKTNAESMTAMMGGHLQAVASSVSSSMSQVSAGNTRMLAIAAPQRMGGALAAVPTLREQGIDAEGISNWRVVFAAKGITPAQVNFWEEALAKTVVTADWKKLLDDNNLESQFMRSRDTAKYLESEYAATRAVMSDLGLTK